MWGRGDFKIVPPLGGLYSGIAPLTTTIELSSNGQDYVALRSKITYIDPYFRDLMWSANPRNTLTYHPSSGSVAGGTIVTVVGAPVYVRDPHDVACIFGERVVQAFYDPGDVISSRERFTRGYCLRALAKSPCRDVRNPNKCVCIIRFCLLSSSLSTPTYIYTHPQTNRYNAQRKFHY